MCEEAAMKMQISLLYSRRNSLPLICLPHLARSELNFMVIGAEPLKCGATIYTSRPDGASSSSSSSCRTSITTKRIRSFAACTCYRLINAGKCPTINQRILYFSGPSIMSFCLIEFLRWEV